MGLVSGHLAHEERLWQTGSAHRANESGRVRPACRDLVWHGLLSDVRRRIVSFFKGPTVFLLGASHRTAGMALREKLYIPEDELSVILPRIKERHRFDELAAISTCNRFELFGVMSQETLTSGHAMA